MDNLSYLFVGYLVIWILIFGYTLIIGRRQKNLEKEIEFINRNIDKLE